MAVPAADALRAALERLGAEPVAEIAAASREQVFAPRSVPTAGTEAALRSLIAGLASGSPDYATLSPPFAELVRRELPRMQGLFASLGELQSVTFHEPGLMGGDAYEVVFANGGLIMSAMLDAEGRNAGGMIQPLGGGAGTLTAGVSCLAAGKGMSALNAERRCVLDKRRPFSGRSASDPLRTLTVLLFVADLNA